MGSPEKGELAKRGMERKESKSIVVIFRYADWVDLVLMFLGTVGAIGDGMSTNCLLVFVSRLMNSLGYGNTQKNHGNFMDEVEKVGIQHTFSLSLSRSVACFSFSTLLSLIFCFFGFSSTVQFILCVLGSSSHGGRFYG